MHPSIIKTCNASRKIEHRKIGRFEGNVENERERELTAICVYSHASLNDGDTY